MLRMENRNLMLLKWEKELLKEQLWSSEMECMVSFWPNTVNHPVASKDTQNNDFMYGVVTED